MVLCSTVTATRLNRTKFLSGQFQRFADRTIMLQYTVYTITDLSEDFVCLNVYKYTDGEKKENNTHIGCLMANNMQLNFQCIE